MGTRNGVTGLILAGGHSRRFGSDKAHHLVFGQAMISRVATAISPICEAVVVSIAAKTPDYDLPGVRFVRDRFPEAGPLAGLHAGLEFAPTTWLLAVACDMPFLSRDTLEELLAARTHTSRAVVASDTAGRLHPLCACYRKDILKVAEAQLKSGHHALHAFLDRLQDVEVVRLSDESLRNINSPSDLDPDG